MVDVVTLNTELAQSWPFFRQDDGQKAPLEAIDVIAMDATDPAALALIESKLSEQYVEDVLESFFSRLSRCLELREKAHAIQASQVQNASMLKALIADGGPAHEITYLKELKKVRKSARTWAALSRAFLSPMCPFPREPQTGRRTC